MPDSRSAGPFSTITTEDGSSAPLYLVPFDKEGRCIAPQTLQDLQAKVDSGQFTDIHIYSHGWNNIFKEAVEHYTEFFTEYFEIRKITGLSEANYRPMLVGVIWPSTALVSEAEEAPEIAADMSVTMRAGTAGDMLFAISELASALPNADVPRFFQLAGKDSLLTRQETLELARILLPVFQHEAADQEGIPQEVTPEKLLKAWEQTGREAGRPDKGKPGALPDEEKTGTTRSDPAVAGFLDFFNPKEIIRKATVFLMKDRAGTVGTHGVGPVLNNLLVRTTTRVHLIGHSFGAKVVLSALMLVPSPRKVASVLLLQPAINAFCFAQSIQENGGKPGAYRSALERTDMPIFSTFSSRDSPLTNFFHLALRRDGDLGEIHPAAGPPSRFAALGGFGPAGMPSGESKTIPMLAPPEKYDLSDPNIRLYALDGSDQCITSHGDVRNRFTEWAMINLVFGRTLR